MNSTEICFLSVRELGRMIRDKEISPVDVAAAHLARIHSLEPTLNSFITLLGDAAMAAARDAEKEIKEGKYRGPFHGIPIGLKDLYYTNGIKTTSGSKLYEGFVPEFDSTVAARLKEAGAILLGKLNMHPLAYGPTGENPDYGDMHNPWNPCPYRRRFQRRFGFFSRCRRMPINHGNRHRGIHPHSCGTLRSGGAQAYLRPSQQVWPDPSCLEPGSRRTDRPGPWRIALWL